MWQRPRLFGPEVMKLISGSLAAIVVEDAAPRCRIAVTREELPVNYVWIHVFLTDSCLY